jgi:hypothetical protein
LIAFSLIAFSQLKTIDLIYHHTKIVRTRTGMIRNITLSGDEALIEQARRQASAEGKTLNELFRAWLAQYVSQAGAGERYDEIMSRLSHVDSGGKYTRDEMNERSWTLNEPAASYSSTPTSSSTRSTTRRRKSKPSRKR